jgi:hypothetical protein
MRILAGVVAGFLAAAGAGRGDEPRAERLPVPLTRPEMKLESSKAPHPSS